MPISCAAKIYINNKYLPFFPLIGRHPKEKSQNSFIYQQVYDGPAEKANKY
jgi:hypothetical protein